MANDVDLKKTQLKGEFDKEIADIKRNGYLDVERLKHKNIMDEIEAMKNAKITSFRRE